MTILICIASSSLAESIINDVSLTLLRGHNYELGDDERTVTTFEYVNVSTWGDYFMFVDRIMPETGDDITYMELNPRLKLFDINDSFIKSVYLSMQWERAETADNLLIGPAIDLNVEGFRYLKLNIFYRFNDNYDDNYQFTPAWAVPFNVGDQSWLFDGFIDWTNPTPQKASSMNFTTQIKWNANRLLNTENNLYLGFEYTYWNNKFGIEDVTENNLNLLFKYHF